MNSDELLKKIHSEGYWRVNIRPTRFEKERIGSLAECKEVVEACQVQLRGWYYPHIDQVGTKNGLDWVESWADNGNIEYWRFHQSAQFIHHLACREDHELNEPPGSLLSILIAVYTVTEIFEFASRLATRGLLAPAAEISITLHGMEGRKLFFWNNPERALYDDYISQISEIPFSRTFEEAEVRSRSTELALEAIFWIFERFNWTAPKEVLAEDQSRLLERRL